jgi:hypothetical protein
VKRKCVSAANKGHERRLVDMTCRNRLTNQQNIKKGMSISLSTTTPRHVDNQSKSQPRALILPRNAQDKKLSEMVRGSPGVAPWWEELSGEPSRPWFHGAEEVSATLDTLDTPILGRRLPRLRKADAVGTQRDAATLAKSSLLSSRHSRPQLRAAAPGTKPSESGHPSLPSREILSPHFSMGLCLEALRLAT